LRYRLAFSEVNQRFEVTGERVESAKLAPNRRPISYYAYESGRRRIKIGKAGVALDGGHLDPQKSILAQLKDPKHYPELGHLEQTFSSIRLYREWSLGRGAPPRTPQPADLPNDFLMEDGRNLGLVLNRLRKLVDTKSAILEHLRMLYEDITDVDVSVEGGTVQVFLQEGRRTIPAARLSDGTLRWLVLLTILLHPNPPGLVCLEEPELGLHPDILPALTRLLREASSRMQLIVTTHSDSVADALTECPDAVVVCEKEEGSTTLRRLSRDVLSAWLKRYSLGELWRRGEIGGNRW
jgi:predicted ATPase